MTESAIGKALTQRDDDWIKPESGTGNLGSYLATLWQRKIAIAIIVAVCVGTALAVALMSGKEYTAHAQLLVTPVPQGDSTPIGLGLLRDSGTPDRDIVTATQLVTNRSVAARAARQLGLSDRPAQLLRRVRAEPVAQSSIVDIAAKASTPQDAAKLADALATATIAQRRAELRGRIDAASAAIAAQLRSLASAGDEAATTRRALRRRAADLSALRGQPSPEFHVQGGPASFPSRASSPKVLRAAGVAGLIGITLGAIAAFVMKAVDPLLRREGQLRELFRLPVLTRVPAERAGRQQADPLTPLDLSAESNEAYRTLRCTIEAVPGHWLGSRSILVAGTSRGEGTTTTAINLASAFAATGGTTILLEADLRHPSIAKSLELGGSPTSADVVTGAIAFEDALVAVEGSGGRLRVLASAADGSWAAEGFSRQAAELLAEAKSMADVVVVDTPPPAEAAGLLHLAHHVDHIVLVARLRRTRLPRLRDFAGMLKDNGLRPTGTVVVGVPQDDNADKS